MNWEQAAGEFSEVLREMDAEKDFYRKIGNGASSDSVIIAEEPGRPGYASFSVIRVPNGSAFLSLHNLSHDNSFDIWYRGDTDGFEWYEQGEPPAIESWGREGRPRATVTVAVEDLGTIMLSDIRAAQVDLPNFFQDRYGHIPLRPEPVGRLVSIPVFPFAMLERIDPN